MWWARVEEATGAGDMTSGVDMDRGATNGYIGLDGVLGRNERKAEKGYSTFEKFGKL